MAKGTPGCSTMTPMSLSASLQQIQQLVNQDITDFFDSYRPRLETIDPWSTAVHQRLAQYCQRPGKRVRALLVALGASLAQQKSLAQVVKDKKVRQLMLLVELKHARLLITDDVGDRDEQRRGLPAFHIQWQQDLQENPIYAKLDSAQIEHLARSYTEIAAAILDHYATWILTRADFTASQLKQIIDIVQEHIYDKTTTGWYVIFDQNVEPLSGQTSEGKLLRGLELVSGEYTFVGPLRLGASLGKPNGQLDSILRQYGQAAGILFQIQDDILGTFGNSAKTGKPVGNDLREGKKTLLVQHAYRQAKTDDKKILSQLLGKPHLTVAEVEKLQAIITKYGGLQYAQQKNQQLAQQAQESLSNLPKSEVQDTLSELIAYIAQREK